MSVYSEIVFPAPDMALQHPSLLAMQENLQVCKVSLQPHACCRTGVLYMSLIKACGSDRCWACCRFEIESRELSVELRCTLGQLAKSEADTKEWKALHHLVLEDKMK